ncbi:hypothetical protein GQ44DRAFT_624564 [Phaeosphaeriaceae sp. PMI808]|nr:hypothetical protein GQ44DRAFT_624564 [Phaeosphaeriaceae sp. PMI808]
MTEQNEDEKRKALKNPNAINEIIAAANKDDRFKLLEDDSVPAADLNNPIHPMFSWIDPNGPMEQMLRLASQFLTQDSVLTFFIPLLYGTEVTLETDDYVTKTFLTNPFGSASYVKRRQMVNGVRKALLCLAHRIEFSFVPRKDTKGYGSTLVSSTKPVVTENCCPIFQGYRTARIEISGRFTDFYESEDGYKASSRCAQFRHDFLLASTLVHEVVHAFGIMRRGNLAEPYIAADDPDDEWGYAWEHFMYGFVINPQDRILPGTHVFVRKVWADSESVHAAGGKEYCDVSMAYVAQWFRQETWDIIAEQGPIAVPPPITHFKVQPSHTAWVVSSECLDVKRDVCALNQQWWEQRASGWSSSILWQSRTMDELMEPNVEVPVRLPHRLSAPLSRT